MNTAQKVILALAATFAAGILFVNVYTSVVDAPNWGSNIPGSINAAREYFRIATPGTFFRVVSPINQVLTLLSLILCWTAGKQVRVMLMSALVLAVAVDAMTFAFFYPRNDIMFVAPLVDVDAVRTAWSQWTTVNWLRSAVCAVVVILDFTALTTMSKPTTG